MGEGRVRVMAPVIPAREPESRTYHLAISD